MNSTLLFAIGMTITLIFAGLMLHQALSHVSVLGANRPGRAQRFDWFSPVGSALIAAVSLATLIFVLA